MGNLKDWSGEGGVKLSRLAMDQDDQKRLSLIGCTHGTSAKDMMMMMMIIMRQVQQQQQVVFCFNRYDW